MTVCHRPTTWPSSAPGSSAWRPRASCSTAIRGCAWRSSSASASPPNTGIADFAGVARALAGEVAERGGEVLLGREITRVRRANGHVELEHPGAAATVARHAVFCAGAWADRLATAAGAPADPRIVPFRGRYLRLRSEEHTSELQSHS